MKSFIVVASLLVLLAAVPHVSAADSSPAPDTKDAPMATTTSAAPAPKEASIVDKAKDAASDAAAAVGNAASNVGTAIGNAFDNAKDAVSNLTSSAVSNYAKMATASGVIIGVAMLG